MTPEELERDLRRFKEYRCNIKSTVPGEDWDSNSAVERLRTHIATLTAERDELFLRFAPAGDVKCSTCGASRREENPFCSNAWHVTHSACVTPMEALSVLRSYLDGYPGLEPQDRVRPALTVLAREISAIRTLDAWAEKNPLADWKNWRDKTGRCFCVLDGEPNRDVFECIFEARSHSDARVAAAEALAKKDPSLAKDSGPLARAQPTETREAWAVRVLDAWAEKHDDRVAATRKVPTRLAEVGKTYSVEIYPHYYYGETRDAARIAAAEALVKQDPSLIEESNP